MVVIPLMGKRSGRRFNSAQVHQKRVGTRLTVPIVRAKVVNIASSALPLGLTGFDGLEYRRRRLESRLP